MTPGDRIRIRRAALRMSQDELSEKSGVGRVHISNIERGEATKIGVTTLQAIAGALGTTVGALLGETELPLTGTDGR